MHGSGIRGRDHHTHIDGKLTWREIERKRLEVITEKTARLRAVREEAERLEASRPATKDWRPRIRGPRPVITGDQDEQKRVVSREDSSPDYSDPTDRESLTKKHFDRHFDRPEVDEIINEQAGRAIKSRHVAGEDVKAIAQALNRLSIPKGEALPLPGSPQVRPRWTQRDVMAAIRSFFGGRIRGDVRPLRFDKAAYAWMEVPRKKPVSDEDRVFKKGPLQIHIEYLEDRIECLKKDVEQYDMMRVAEKERDKLLSGLGLRRHSGKATRRSLGRPVIASSPNAPRLPKEEITGPPANINRLVDAFASQPFEGVLSRALEMQQTRDVVATYAGFGTFKLFVNSATSEGAARGKVLNPSESRGYDPSDPDSASRGHAPRELRRLMETRANGRHSSNREFRWKNEDRVERERQIGEYKYTGGELNNDYSKDGIHGSGYRNKYAGSMYSAPDFENTAIQHSWAFLKRAFNIPAVINKKKAIKAVGLPADFRFCPNCGEYNSTGRYAGPGRNCWSCDVVLGSVNRHARPICPCCRAQNTNAATGFICVSCEADFQIYSVGDDLASIVRECIAHLPSELSFMSDYHRVSLIDSDGVEYSNAAESADLAIVNTMAETFLPELTVIFRENRRWLPAYARAVMVGEGEVIGCISDRTDQGGKRIDGAGYVRDVDLGAGHKADNGSVEGKRLRSVYDLLLSAGRRTYNLQAVIEAAAPSKPGQIDYRTMRLWPVLGSANSVALYKPSGADADYNRKGGDTWNGTLQAGIWRHASEDLTIESVLQDRIGWWLYAYACHLLRDKLTERFGGRAINDRRPKPRTVAEMKRREDCKIRWLQFKDQLDFMPWM